MAECLTFNFILNKDVWEDKFVATEKVSFFFFFVNDIYFFYKSPWPAMMSADNTTNSSASNDRHITWEDEMTETSRDTLALSLS